MVSISKACVASFMRETRMGRSVRAKRWTTGGMSTALLLSLLAFSVGQVEADPNDFKKGNRPIIGALREPLEKLPQIENFQVIGETIIPNPGEAIERGRNGSIAIANDCLYVGNRLGRRSGTGLILGALELPPEIAIVDISHPRRPTVVSYLTTPAKAVNRELRAFSAPLNTLFVQNFRAGSGLEDNVLVPAPNSPAVNNIQIYDVSNCRAPQLRGTIQLDGPAGADNSFIPHEFFVWQDPSAANRILVYVSSFAAFPDLRVYEVLGAPNPSNAATMSTPVATFTLAPAVPSPLVVDPARWDPEHFVFDPPPATQATRLHSMSVSADGTRVYMAARGPGSYILDSSSLADRFKAVTCFRHTATVDRTTNADPTLCLRKINPEPGATLSLTPPYPGFVHTAVPVPGRPYVLIGGERNGTRTCPWNWGSVVHTIDETNPQFVSRFMLPENLAANCFPGGPGDPAFQREFSSHQITAFPNLFFISWYSGGLRAWDIANPNLPLEVGVFVPRPRKVVVERFRNSPDVWVWPYPVFHNGLLYIADENGGLYILKFKGPRADELPEEGTFQGNANNP